MSSDKKNYIMLSRSESTWFLINNHPKAFFLLTIIALRARRVSGHCDSLEVGDAHIGDWTAVGLERGEYRYALKVLEKKGIIRIKETNRTRKKSKDGETTKGTLVQLLRSDVFDINPDFSKTSQPNLSQNATTGTTTDFVSKNHMFTATGATTQRPLNDHEQEGIRMNNKEMMSDNRSENKIISFISSNKYKKVISMREDDLLKTLQEMTHGFTQDEIYSAIEIAKKQNSPVSSIPNYLKTIILNLRKEKTYARSTKNRSSHRVKNDLSGCKIIE